MKRKRLLAFCLSGCLLLTPSTLAAANDAAPPEDPCSSSTEVSDETACDYQLKAGELTEVYDRIFDEMVTVTIDPNSTRDGANDLRSDIIFDNCTFHGGLTVQGDYHAMISLGEGCSFGDDSVVICKAVTSDSPKETALEDNRVKLFVACEGVTVETDAAIGLLTDGPDVVFNGTVYSKSELAPEADFLGIYNLYEDDAMTYIKLAIGEDDSVAFLD